MSFPDYKTARQRHVGGMLDHLEARKLLRWLWHYDTEKATAYYLVTAGAGLPQKFNTKEVEMLVQFMCDALKIEWRPLR